MIATRPPVPSERSLQRATAAYFKAVLLPEVLWFHCPNEGKRGAHAQADFKLGGGLSGVADWMLGWKKSCIYPADFQQSPQDGLNFMLNPFPFFQYMIPQTAWLELKSVTGKLTPAQQAFRERVLALGHYHEVCRSLEAVASALRGWNVPTRPHSFLNGVVRVAA